MTLKLHFDAEQTHQLEAIASVVDLLQGLPRAEAGVLARDDEIVANAPHYDDLAEYLLTDNVSAVRLRHNSRHPDSAVDDDRLTFDDGPMLEGVSVESHRCPHFTLEMETGTGKTYVYLRTILELFQRYGLRKFMIVVPSVAILEGVKKAFEITRSHFQGLYGSTGLGLREYDGQQLGFVRSFATSQHPVVMVTTLQSVASLKNLFFRETEKLAGEKKPFEWVQATRPIVILDEPQNMGSERSQQAIRTLRPLFVLRYSATHRLGETPNLVYRLTPVQAFRLGLVKQIEVVGVQELGFGANLALRLLEVKRKPVAAKVRVPVTEKGRVTEQEIELRQGQNLQQKTKMADHAGFVVREITVGTAGRASTVEFENGVVLTTHDALQGSRVDVWRAQIEKTVEAHFERQSALRPLGIKVLSLFFIDRVANYTADDGIIRRLFDATFERLKGRAAGFSEFAAPDVRRSYFASSRDKKTAAVTALDDVSDSSAEAKEAFKLIMRDKERLLSFPDGKDPGTAVAFIFAHSALKEGWDNPNVFQICTLNETVSALKKRQEIGRGLRLCVDQQGRRPTEDNLNVLTVVANDSYEGFVRALQDDYVEEGLIAPPDPGRGHRRAPARRRDALFLDAAFRGFWRKLCQGLRYRLELDTDALVADCIARLEKRRFPQPTIALTRGRFVLVDYALSVLPGGGAGNARLALDVRKSTGDASSLGLVSPTRFEFLVKVGDRLAAVTRDPFWKGFEVQRVWNDHGETRIRFANDVEVSQSLQYRAQSMPTADSTRTELRVSTELQPIPDVIGRAAEATHLTRQTLVRVFQGLSEATVEPLFRGPETWTDTFIAELRDVLADHVVAGLRYEPTGRPRTDADPEHPEAFFPPTNEQPQRELIDGGPRSLYDLVQVDSDVERQFVSGSLPKEALRLYFKFPPKFRLQFPKAIGNYNPDWGLVRLGPDGAATLELVRETKGSEDLESLRFSTEGRKVRAAQRYFEALGIDYRVVSHETQEIARTARERFDSRERSLRRLSKNDVPTNRKRVPVYDLRVAAGAFSSGQEPQLLGHLALEAPGDSAALFVARVLGDSMNQVAPDGAWCLFENLRAPGAAPAHVGDKVIAQLESGIDPELGAYTFKLLANGPTGTRLEPRSRNRTHKPIEIDAHNPPELLARFVNVLDDDDVCGVE